MKKKSPSEPSSHCGMPVVAHAVNNSGIMLADTAAWVEHAAAGYVFTDEQTVSSLALRLDTLGTIR